MGTRAAAAPAQLSAMLGSMPGGQELPLPIQMGQKPWALPHWHPGLSSTQQGELNTAKRMAMASPPQRRLHTHGRSLCSEAQAQKPSLPGRFLRHLCPLHRSSSTADSSGAQGMVSGKPNPAGSSSPALRVPCWSCKIVPSFQSRVCPQPQGFGHLLPDPSRQSVLCSLLCRSSHGSANQSKSGLEFYSLIWSPV